MPPWTPSPAGAAQNPTQIQIRYPSATPWARRSRHTTLPDFRSAIEAYYAAMGRCRAQVLLRRSASQILLSSCAPDQKPPGSRRAVPPWAELRSSASSSRSGASSSQEPCHVSFSLQALWPCPLHGNWDFSNPCVLWNLPGSVLECTEPDQLCHRSSYIGCLPHFVRCWTPNREEANEKTWRQAALLKFKQFDSLT